MPVTFIANFILGGSGIFIVHDMFTLLFSDVYIVMIPSAVLQ